MKYIAIILICVASLNPLKGYSNVDLGVHKVYSEQGLWHDLITPNIEESKEFYNKIFGWTFKEKNIKGFKYALIYNNKMLIGGMLEIPNTKSSTWITSLALSSQELNKRIKLAVANGAKLALNPIKVPGIGKQVIFEGPQGIIFSLVSVNAYNSAIVNEKKAYNDWLGIELWSDDLEKSKAFYESTFNISSEAITIDNKPYWYFKEPKSHPLCYQILSKLAPVHSPLTGACTANIFYELGVFFWLRYPCPQVHDGNHVFFIPNRQYCNWM